MQHVKVAEYIKALYSKYSETELSSIPGNTQLRYEIFSPLFENIYQNKVVYKERYSCILTLENIIISPEKFEATATPNLLINGGSSFDKYFSLERKWKIAAVWEHIRLIGTHLSTPYANWSIWCDPETVTKVENLILNNQMDEALDILKDEY